MKIQLQQGYILKAMPYGETSLILEVLTEQQGRLGLLAKGARRPRAPVRGCLVPFQGVLLSWTGRGELPVLTDAEPLGSEGSMMGEAFFAACYVNELVLRLVVRGVHPGALYGHYRACLDGLRSNIIEPSLRRFERHLLDALGFGIRWDRERQGDVMVEAHRFYRVEPEHGVMVAGEQDGVPGWVLLEMAHDNWPPESLPWAFQILRGLLLYRLEGQVLRSGEMLRQLRRLTGQASQPQTPSRHRVS
jgi:DNA repair protein RecO (recombination protein O)